MVLRSAPARWLAVAALVVMAVGTFGAHHDTTPPGPVWLGVLLAAGAVLPALVELPASTSLVTSGLLTGVYFAAGYGDGPIFLAVPVVALVVFLVTGPMPMRRLWTWAGVAALLGVAGLWARDALHDVERPTLWQSLGFLALVAAASAVAASLRSREVAAAERARSAASEERLRMAADLHDGVGHGLAVIAMQAGAALHVLDKDPAAARAGLRANLEAIRDASRESLDLLRHELSQLAGESAPRAASLGLGDVPALVDRVRSGGLDVRVVLRLSADEVRALPDPVGRAAYAVVQEGLTNVLRHAAATRAVVTVEASAAGLVVTVSDDGGGVAPGEAPGSAPATGLGIAGMRARVEGLGGTLEAGPGDTGFLVRATLPLGASS